MMITTSITHVRKISYRAPRRLISATGLELRAFKAGLVAEDAAVFVYSNQQFTRQHRLLLDVAPFGGVCS